MGYLPPKRALSPQEAYRLLRYKSYPALRYQLKNSTKEVLERGDQVYYEALLKAFVPNWDVPIEESSFIGSGSGAGSLNVYRKVRINGKIYFEKVYFNFLTDLERVEWFLSNVYTVATLDLKTPRIKQKYAGELVTIVYYEYINLQPLSDMAAGKTIIDWSTKLYSTSLNMPIRNWHKTMPPHLKTYSDIEYDIGIAMAKKRLEEKKVNVNQLEEQAAISRHILTHGDLASRNVYRNNMVVDWDTFGIYPIGFECVRIFSDLKSDENFIDWLIVNYKPVIEEKDWKDFKRNACYFFYIHCLGKEFSKMKDTEWEAVLINELSKY